MGFTAQNNILLNMQSVYTSLTRIEKKVADYILQNPNEASVLTIDELAEACGVSLTSVFRFCKTLQFKGFQDFRVQLLLSLNEMSQEKDSEKENAFLPSEVSQSDSVDSVVQKVLNSHLSPLYETVALVDEKAIAEAANIILHSDQVRFFGVGGSHLTAMEGMYKFLHIMPNVYCLADPHMQIMGASTLNDHDVAIFISYSGNTREMVEMARRAKNNKCRCIGITQYNNTPMAELMDVLLLCGGYESPLQEGSMPSKTAHMFMLDLLFTEVYRRQYSYSTKINKQVLESVSDKEY